MNEPATSVRHGAPPPARTEAPRTQQSLLFPSLFGKLDRRRRLNVFDAGPATPETVNFFSAFRCRLHFASLFSDPLVLDGTAEVPKGELADRFTKSMAIPQGTRFDLCLFWDFPNYLDDRALRAFNAALRPYVHPDTLGHAFAVRTADTRLDHRLYGIRQPHLFTVRDPWEPRARLHPHPQAILINLMTGFDIDRGMLLPDGRLEVILNAARDSTSD